MQKMQNRDARIITGKPYKIRSRDLLTELGWQILKERRDTQKATLMFIVKIRKCREIWLICSVYLIMKSMNL
jgi:hypothetical protein